MAIISESVSLKPYNTFGLEAKSRFFATYANDGELVEIVDFCKKEKLNWFVLGGGANVIFDGDYDGCVIHPVGADIALEEGVVVADAGVEWDDFVAFTVGIGYYGLENLSLIPGSVGASPVQNIGAYGVEAKDCILWVEYLDTDTMKIVRIPNEECHFGYRESIFKNELKGKAIIVRVAFKLSKNGKLKLNYGAVRERVEELGGETLQNVRQAIIEIRQSKLPDPKVQPNAGSFFKNPVVTKEFADNLLGQHQNMPYYPVETGVKLAAGWLIEKAGWKGKTVGKMSVHSQQALVLVNSGNASGREIVEFSDLIISDLNKKFNIILEREVNIIK